MRTRHCILAMALLTGAVQLPAQSTHPKFRSREFAIASFTLIPTRVYGSSKRVEAGEVTSRSQELARDVGEELENVLNDLNWEIREPILSEQVLGDVQTAYDRLTQRLYSKPKDVDKGLLSLGEEAGKLELYKVADALVFSRVTAEFDETVTASRTATTISMTFSRSRSLLGRFSLVDARTGAVLYFFEVKAKGDDEQSRQGLRIGIATALKKVTSLVVALPPLAVEAPRPEKAVPDATKFATWKGESITILGTKPLHCTGKATDGPLIFRRFGADDRSERLSVNSYAGRTGKIVDARVSGYETEIVIQLDDGEKLIASSDMGIAFQAELDAAKKLIGTSWWSRGPQTIAQPENVCGDFDAAGRNRLNLKRLQKVTVIGAAFGTHLQRLLLTVQTEDGRQGILDGWSGYDYLEERYHLVEHQVGVATKPYSNRFFLRNPR